MGGPFVSLLQGALCMFLYKKIKNGAGSLFTLWMGISGLMAFFGYVIIAPISTAGDTGKIFQLLEIPMIWQIMIAIGGLIFITLLLLRFHRGFERFVPENISDNKLLRAKWAKLLIIYQYSLVFSLIQLCNFP